MHLDVADRLIPKIYLPQAAVLARGGQLEVCTGTTTGDEAGLHEVCVTGARVPMGRWRTPTAEEIGCLTQGGADALPGETLEFLSLTTESAIARAQRALTLGFAITSSSAGIPSDSLTALARFVPDLLDAFTSSGGKGFRIASDVKIGYDDPNLVTTTRDPRDGNRLLGLHVDSQERKALCERHTCKRLVSVNIAGQPRWFLFVGVTIRGVADYFKAMGVNDIDRLGATNAGRSFLTTTDCAVFRISNSTWTGLPRTRSEHAARWQHGGDCLDGA